MPKTAASSPAPPVPMTGGSITYVRDPVSGALTPRDDAAEPRRRRGSVAGVAPEPDIKEIS